MADYEVSKIMWIAIVVALATSIFVIAKPQIKTLANSTFGKISAITDGIGKSNNTLPSNTNKINPNDAKWVQKGDWGTNGKWVVDKDGNAVIYAMDASKPIVFHDMHNENAKLPMDTVTTLTFQDKVQGDTNSSMWHAFADTFEHTFINLKAFTNLKTINNLDTNVDTSNVTDMSDMFYNSQLTSVDLSKWDTSNVTNMGSMFEGSKLTSVGDLSKWNTSNATAMNNMFYNSQLTTVGNLSKWNTSNVIYMGAMFQSTKLTSVGDLSQWNTSNVYNMSWMFYGSKLTPPSWYHSDEWDVDLIQY